MFPELTGVSWLLMIPVIMVVFVVTLFGVNQTMVDRARIVLPGVSLSGLVSIVVALLVSWGWIWLASVLPFHPLFLLVFFVVGEWLVLWKWKPRTQTPGSEYGVFIHGMAYVFVLMCTVGLCALVGLVFGLKGFSA